MRKLLGLLLAVGLIGGATLVLTGAPAGACSCGGDLVEHADEYEAVFLAKPSGRVAAISQRYLKGLASGQVTMDVSTVYKGSVAARQAVLLPTGSSSMCGVDLDRPGDLLVFGYRETGEITLPKGIYATNLCSSIWINPDGSTDGTIDGAPLDLAVLGDPSAPRPGSSPSVAAHRRYVPDDPIEWLAVGALVVGAAAVGRAVLRRRRAASAPAPS